MSVVTLESEDSLGLITISRPEKLNALSTEVVREFRAALQTAANDDDIKVLLVTGAGTSFSAGFDLTEEAEGDVKGAASWHGVLQPDVDMTMELWSFPKPTIAVVRGWCLAGGCDLAMACDMIVAGDDAKFGEPEIRYGSGPVTLLMPFLLGQKKANELLFTGDVVGAAEAERIGLVNRVVPADLAMDEARRLAGRIALAPLPVLKFTKLGLNRAWQAAGLVQAVQNNLDLSAILNAADSPEQDEFDRLAREQGLKAALAWRDARYGVALSEA